MMNQKQQMLTEPVKRFLIQAVAKSGPKPERLCSELELCERFSVCRPTVHKAVEELLEIGYLLHLPKRRGIFSNPAYVSVVPYSIGIVGERGNCSYFNYYSSRILGSFLSHLGDLKAMTTFLILNRNPEQAAEEILKSGLDAILWNNPDECYYPVIEKLIDRKIAVAAIGSYTNAAKPLTAANSLSPDFRYQGQCRAEFFLHRGCSNPVYCGNPGPTYDGFKECLKTHKIIFKDTHLINDSEPMSKLTRILESELVDGLICDGNKDQHNRVLKTLLNYRPKFPVLLSYGLDLEVLKKDYPSLSLFSLLPKTDLKQLDDMGRSAAGHIREMLLFKRNYRFVNESFKNNFDTPNQNQKTAGKAKSQDGGRR